MLLKKLIAVLLLLPISLYLYAQDVIEPVNFPDVNTLTATNVFEALFQPVYSLLVLAFGYLSAYIPGVKKVAPFYRVLAFGLVAGVAFHLFGVSVWKVAVTYLLTTGIVYDGFLKNLTKKKTPAAPVLQG